MTASNARTLERHFFLANVMLLFCNSIISMLMLGDIALQSTYNTNV